MVELTGMAFGFTFAAYVHLYKRVKQLEKEVKAPDQSRKTKELEEEMLVLKEIEVEQIYNKSYGNPEVMDYLDREYARQEVKQ